MKNTPDSPPAELSDFFKEIESAEKREKIKLPPELVARMQAFARRLQDKLMAGKNLTQADLAPIARFKLEVETAKLRHNIEKQYPACLETLDYFGFLKKGGLFKKGDAPPPPVEKVMQSFSSEMLAVAKDFAEPTLLLVPECSFKRKIEAIDKHRTMEGQNYCHVNEMFIEVRPQARITGYRVVIVDGAREMRKEKLKKGDDLTKTFIERLQIRKKKRRPHEKGMSCHAYALLMMHGLRIKAPIDPCYYHTSEDVELSYTPLDDDLDDDWASHAFHAPAANWLAESIRASFSYDDLDDVLDGARFRSSVGGDVLL